MKSRLIDNMLLTGWPVTLAVIIMLSGTVISSCTAEELTLPAASVTGTEPGFRALTEEDFVNVNCLEDTWKWEDGILYCTGNPVGVLRTAKHYKNLELVVEWCHRKPAGNSGVFLWATDESIDKLAAAGKPGLPHGIEVQVLDTDYGRQYEERTKKKGDWFTSHGDVFPTGVAKMKPFPPISPNGSRSFPTSERTRPAGEWNHYYIRAINGEVRLWVNGVEVSGGNGCEPSSGYLCLESEGAPVEFRNMRIRELP